MPSMTRGRTRDNPKLRPATPAGVEEDLAAWAVWRHGALIETAQALQAIPSARAREEAQRLFAAANIMRSLAVKLARQHEAPRETPSASHRTSRRASDIVQPV